MNLQDWAKTFYNAILLVLKDPSVQISGAVLCYAFLFLPTKWAAYLGIVSMREQYRSWFGFLLLVCVTLLVVQALRGAYYEARRRTRVRSELRSLSGEEWLLLLECLDNDQKTIIQQLGETGAQQALVNKGILLEGHGRGSILAWAFTVDDYAWGYLQWHPKLVARGRAIATQRTGNDWGAHL